MFQLLLGFLPIALLFTPTFATDIDRNDISKVIKDFTDEDRETLYMALVVTWGPTACLDKRIDKVKQWDHVNDPINPCSPSRDRWIMHGIWPQSSENGVQKKIKWKCKPSTKGSYNPIVKEVLYNPIQDLDKFWFRVDASSNQYEFLQRQFEHHGFCALALDIVSSIEDYFELGKNLYASFGKIGDYLSQNKIKPGMTKTSTEIIDAIKAGLGTDKNPRITCTGPDKDNLNYLYEAVVCVKISNPPVLIDCPLLGHVPTCTGNVIYKKFEHKYGCFGGCNIL